ncbi:hypothetical protein N0V93_007823 [Gnomoniopsis smithogilvyi]|uniref:Carrier domain-containing protein n=1 Tax=Gnomoniopsis smithogilvyi TaxID=1191159 RepID=A0A9W8YKJ9_9PEZI|nr:hypothetical protein N0V93_007823 [Gnomoniopsis smithogilvyi]
MAPSLDAFIPPQLGALREAHNKSDFEHAKADAVQVAVVAGDESSDGQLSIGESIEDMLRELWADVLDLDPEEINSDSHFFELGGNSLATAELVAAAAHQYPSMCLKREMVFQAPLFAELAAIVSLAGAGSSVSEVSSLQPFELVDGEDVKIAAEQCGVLPGEIEDIYPATALQAGLMARSLSIPGTYVSQWLFHCAYVVDPETLREWLEQTVQKLAILRTAMATSAEHGFVQVVLAHKTQVAISRVASLDKWDQDFPVPAITLGTPLSRMTVVVAENREAPSVMWHAHHASYDMATLELIAKHLGDIASGANMLPPPPNFNSFVAYSLAVRKNPTGKTFWSQQLLDSPAPAFPSAIGTLDQDSNQSASPFRTNALYTYPLPHINVKMNFTQANVFRSAWAFLLGCYEHSDDVVFGVTNGGRYAPVANCIGIVGPMIATSPMRVKLDYSCTVSEFLQQTSLQAVKINDWEQVGLSAIHELGPDGQRACGFRTLVNVQTTDAMRRSQFLTAPDDCPEKADAMDYGLVLELFPREGSTIPLRMSYDSGALRHDQVLEIAKQLEKVIAAFITHPEATLNSVAANMDNASDQDGTISRIRKHAAVECGILDERVQKVSPCTTTQAALMTASMQHSSAYSSQIVFRIPEQVSREEVVVAFESLYQHAPVLRTRFFYAAGRRLMQAVIAETIQWRESLDLEDYTISDSDGGFKLGSPLSRFGLVRGVNRESRVHWVVMTAHSAICDTFKVDQMLQFLNSAIPGSEELVTSPSITFSPPSISSFSAVEQSEVYESFWAQKLQDCAIPSFPEVASAQNALASSYVQKNIALPKSAGCSTLKVTAWIHGAWALTLVKYQDSSDVIFGVGLDSGRYDQPTLGPTYDILPQRISIDDFGCSISRFVQDIETQTLALSHHLDYGISSIQTINESCAAACSFQNLIMVHFPARSEPLPTSGKSTLIRVAEGAEIGWRNPSQVVRNYALVLEIIVSPERESLVLDVGFDPAVLDPKQVRRLLDHFEHVLLQTADISSDSSLRDIHHIAPSHWEELQQWNGNVPEPLEKGVHELFESRVDMQPGEPAVCARDGEWTFAELDTVSEKLARWLRSMGVKSGTYVPLLFEKCGLAIVAMLGVLKAGGASVALDPSHPAKRLQGLVSGMGECIVISSGHNRELAASLGRRVVVLDTNTLRALSSRPPLPRLSQEIEVIPASTAFVLFTSGSTGMPKGILIPHRAFSSSIRGHGEVLRFTTGPGSRNFQFTAYTSDVSIGEIFTSLALGSCVCVPSDWDRKNNIAGSMRDFNVSWAFFTPSVATLLRPEEVPSLKTLVFGGETASPDNFKTWAPYLYLINSFGPAETSIWSHCIPRPVELTDVGSNIGYGVSCATWITDPDDYNKLLPIGAIGELLTEGPNVAAGYLNASEKTNATFVTDPAWMPADRKSMRIYRSGDLARFLPNGMVQFLGRRDHQVKLNGLRIELGEIEHQIRQKVSDTMLVAVDVVNPHPVGSARILAAFIAPKNPLQDAADQADDNGAPCTSITTSAEPEIQKLLSLLVSNTSETMCNELVGLEDALIGSLPRHMVPTAFVPLREMPLTASAKIDRKVLKQLASMVSTADLVRLGTRGKTRQLHAPGTVMERVLARLWGAALGRELELDVRDSFFQIGGDSLSAMRLVSLARREGLKVSVEQIFTSSVLQDMAQVALVTDQEDENVDDSSGSLSSTAIAPFATVGGVESAASSLLTSAAEQLGIQESDIEDIYPCTPLQEGLLAVSQDAKGSYVAQMVHELSPDVDLPLFQEAWSTVLDDWPILRTRFFPWLLDDGSIRLMQAVVKEKPRWLKPRSLKDYLKLDARDKMQTGDSMLRLAAFQDKKTQKHHFVMTIHHAVYDGWMLGLLLTAVRRAYSGMSKPATIPYNVFINRLEAADVNKSQSFWQRYVSGAPRVTWPELPGLDFRPKSNSVETVTLALPDDRSSMRFTPTTWLRTAFAILLGAYSCTDDIVFASTVYGRASGLLPSAELVAGPTLATIPVRVGIARERLVDDLLAEVQADSAEMLAHEQHGMQNIRRYNMEALASVDAQSLLVVQVDEPHAAAPQNVDSEAADALKFTSTPPSGLENGFLSCALVIEATVSADRLHLIATYDDKVLQSDGVQRFLRQMTHIVNQLCSGSPEGCCIADLSLAPSEDVEEMHKWNGAVPEPMQALVHELFHKQAEEQPDSEALVSCEGVMTFQELDNLSTRLAGHLWESCGLRTGMRVPLLFEKSMWAVVAMIAVLKVGAANVALNPAQPVETLKSLVSDVDAELVLCSEKNISIARDVFTNYFSVGPSIRDEGSLTGENGARDSIVPENLAFLLFTSGSTGKPKAIMIDHSAFTSSMRGHGETLCYNKGGRNLQFTAYTSDVSIGEIFTSLTRGATVCIPSEEERMNDLAGAMERMRVDWAFLTPSVASLLDPDHVPTLRTLLYGGETATVTNVKTWANRLHLINSFGPAETSIWSHAHPRFTDADIGSDIGWSMGCATWIVDPDDYGRLMPIGAIGELVVEGPNVAAGYYNNPEKTQHAFVKSLPFLPEQRRNRIYRMGDLARWMPGGRVQFLGRKDTQVKLHGLKVDVGEVENKIRVALDGGVGLEVAVEMIENPADSSDSRLVAFMNTTPVGQPQDRDNVTIVAEEGTLQAFVERTKGLRADLASVLPAFTIPSFFVPLTSMPLSASAKTDRKRLRAIVADMGFASLARFALSTKRAIQAPESKMEKLLHKMWCTVLGLGPDDFGVEADFFECGGDSIAAMKMASLARASQVSLAVQDVYDHPVLGAQSLLLDSRSGASLAASLPEVTPFSLLPKSVDVDLLKIKAADLCGTQPKNISDIYPLTATQQSIIQQTISRPGAFWLHNVFEIEESVDLDRLERAWRRVLSARAILRTRIIETQDGDGQLLQAVLTTPDEVTHVECPSMDIDTFIASEKHRMLGFGRPLTRAVLLNRKWFVLVLHHSTYDAWSMSKIFESLELEYTRLAQDASDMVVMEQVGFNHFVKSLQDQDQNAAATFWRQTLAGVSTRPFIPLKSVGDSSTKCLLQHTITLPTPTTSDTRAHGTQAELVYAAIGLALHQQLQTTDTVLRLVSTGRTSSTVSGVEDLIGPTVTSVPLRMQHSQDTSTVGRLVSHVHEQLRALAPYEHYGFENVGRVSSDAEAACSTAPQVVVHPFDPYAEQAAGGIGLKRRELSAFNDDGAPFTLDISLLSRGKVLEGMIIRALFSDSVIEEQGVRRLVALLDAIMQVLVEAKDDTSVIDLLTTANRQDFDKAQRDMSFIRAST